MENTLQPLTPIVAEKECSMPIEHVEDTKPNENKVVCKLFLKGNPIGLRSTVENILTSLLPKKSNGTYDTEKSGEYIMTLMVEKA